MKAFIVDDEEPNRKGLKFLLAQHCPDVIIAGEADSAHAARKHLNQLSVDILLLDINLPNENGFELLNSLPEKKFLVVFVTAYSEYAVRAFKANAVDYLLKPVDTDELVSAIEKCKQRLNQTAIDGEQNSIYYNSIKNAGNDLAKKSFPSKLTLPHLHGFQIVAVEDILFLEADGNYTTLHFLNREPFLVTRGIKEFENLLDPSVFFRAHKSALINLHYVKEYSSIDGQFAVMNNGIKIMISRRRLDEFMSAINNLSSRI